MLTEAPKISVLTATRDRPNYLAEALASVRAQTEIDYEHLVLDDASVESARVEAILQAARAQDSRLHYTQRPQPYGRPAACWNALLRAARGRYICVLDDDNRYRSDYLDKMSAPLDVDPNSGAVSCGWARVGPAGESLDEDIHWNLATSEVNLWRSNTIDSNALLVRREVFDQIGGFSEGLSTCEDWHFVIRLTRAVRVLHLPDVLLERREHPGARSQTAAAESGNWVRIRREFYPDGPPSGALEGARFMNVHGHVKV